MNLKWKDCGNWYLCQLSNRLDITVYGDNLNGWYFIVYDALNKRQVRSIKYPTSKLAKSAAKNHIICLILDNFEELI